MFETSEGIFDISGYSISQRDAFFEKYPEAKPVQDLASKMGFGSDIESQPQRADVEVQRVRDRQVAAPELKIEPEVEEPSYEPGIGVLLNEPEEEDWTYDQEEEFMEGVEPAYGVEDYYSDSGDLEPGRNIKPDEEQILSENGEFLSSGYRNEDYILENETDAAYVRDFKVTDRYGRDTYIAFTEINNPKYDPGFRDAVKAINAKWDNESFAPEQVAHSTGYPGDPAIARGVRYTSVYPYAKELGELKELLYQLKKKGLGLPVSDWEGEQPPDDVVRGLFIKNKKAEDILKFKRSQYDKWIADHPEGVQEATKKRVEVENKEAVAKLESFDATFSMLSMDKASLQETAASITKRREEGIRVSNPEIEEYNNSLSSYFDQIKIVQEQYESLPGLVKKATSTEEMLYMLRKDYNSLRKGLWLSSTTFGDLMVGLGEFVEASYSPAGIEITTPTLIADYGQERRRRKAKERELFRDDASFDAAFDSPENLGRFLREETFRQLPIFAVMAATGGSGSALGLSARGAAAMSGITIGAMTAGQQIGDMTYEEFLLKYDDIQKYGVNLEYNDKDRSSADKYLVGLGFGAAEGLLGTAPTVMMGSRFFKGATNTLRQRGLSGLLTGRAATRHYTKEFFKEFAVGAAGESITEGLTQLSQNIISGKDDIWEGVDHATFSGGFFGGTMGGGSVAMGVAARTLMPSEGKKEIDALAKKLRGYQLSYDATVNKQSDEAKILKANIDKTNETIADKIENFGSKLRNKMSYSAFNEYKKAFQIQSELRAQARDVGESKIPNAQKKEIIGELAESYSINQAFMELFKQSSNKFNLLKISDKVRYEDIRYKAIEKLNAEGIDVNEGKINKEAYEIYLTEEAETNTKNGNKVLRNVKKKHKKYNFKTEKEALDFANEKIKNENTSAEEVKFWKGVVEDGGALNGQAQKVGDVYTYITTLESMIKNERQDTGTHEVSHLVLWDWITEKGFDLDLVAGEIKQYLEVAHPDIAGEMFGLIDPAQQVERLGEESKREGEFHPEEVIAGFIERIGRINKDKNSKVNQTFLYRLGRLFNNKAKVPSDLSTPSAIVDFMTQMATKINDGTFDVKDLKAAEDAKIFEEIAKGADTKTDKKKEPSKSKSKSVLDTINALVPASIKTKDDFQSRDVFDPIYHSTLPGGAIYNYVNSRAISKEEAALMLEGVVDRLINYDPAAVRKTESGKPITFGEFIFANTRFSKLDAKKKLAIASTRRAESLDANEARQIADDSVDMPVEEETGIKERPLINPLAFTGVPSGITISKKPEGKLTFKTIAKQYAGEVGEQIIGIPAKKIDEAAANLGSIVEARAIQQFFFKADNLEKFIKILPKYNIALPETKIGREILDVPKTIKGTGLNIPKRVIDYFYQDFVDPSGKLTSPKGRSKGLTSQVPVRKLKPEFLGTISSEAMGELKLAVGITPKGELNILPKGELRSPIGQLLKGMAKTYSSLAANTLVRQEMGVSGFTKSDIAGVAAGKRDAMKSISAAKLEINNLEVLGQYEKAYSGIRRSVSKQRAYTERLRKKRPDLDEEQVLGAVSSVFDFITRPEIPQNKKSKLEKLAFHYVANAYVILPEDGYKVIEAERLSAVKKIDPFSFKNPSDIIDAHPTKARINPDEILEFSNKKKRGNGIVVYDVEDSKAGQAAVRQVADTHYGEKWNGWCLIARLDEAADVQRMTFRDLEEAEMMKSVFEQEGRFETVHLTETKLMEDEWLNTLDEAEVVKSEFEKSGKFRQETIKIEKIKHKRAPGDVITKYVVSGTGFKEYVIEGVEPKRKTKDPLEVAWKHWNDYNFDENGHRIAFQNGKLLAFRDGNKKQWWDKKDKAHTYVPARGVKKSLSQVQIKELVKVFYSVLKAKEGRIRNKSAKLDKDNSLALIGDKHKEAFTTFIEEGLTEVNSPASIILLVKKAVEVFGEGTLLTKTQINNTKKIVDRYESIILSKDFGKKSFGEMIGELEGSLERNLFEQYNAGIFVLTKNLANKIENIEDIATRTEIIKEFIKNESRSIRGFYLNTFDIRTNAQLFEYINDLLPEGKKLEDHGFKVVIQNKKGFVYYGETKLSGYSISVDKKNMLKSNNITVLTTEANEAKAYVIKALTNYVKLINNAKDLKQKASLINEALAAMSLMSLNQDSPIRTASMPGFAVTGINNDKLEIDHSIPIKQINKEIKKLLEGNGSIEAVKDLLNNSTVNLIPTKIHNRLSLQDIQSDLNTDRYADKEFIKYINAQVKKGNIVVHSIPTTKSIAVKETISRAVLKSRSMSYNENPKGISVYDFDDTLAFSKSNVMYTRPGESMLYNASPKSFDQLGERSGLIFLATDVKEAQEYARNNSGKVREIVVEDSRLATEKQMLSLLEEVGVDVSEGLLYEMVDSRFEDFYIGDENLNKVKSEMKARGYGGFKYKDGSQLSDKGTNSVAIVDKSIIKQPDKMTPAEFASNGEALLEEGVTFNFSEFDKVIQGTPGPLIPRIKKAIDKFGNKNIFILTARPEASEHAIHAFMKGLGLSIPIKNITGLANSTAQAKADWMVGKVAEGYNDFYFVDDAIKNVDAVKQVLSNFDVKGKVQQAIATRKRGLSYDLNKMIERNKGVKAKASFAQVIARKKGASKGKFKFFVPPSAEDFRGLTSYTLAGKGKQGEADQAFFEKNLVIPYTRGVAMLEKASQELKKDYRELLDMYDMKNRLGQKLEGTEYTIDQAIRIYLWTKQGKEIPGMYKRSQTRVSNLVAKDHDLVGFAEGLQEISKKEEWVEPKEFWDVGSILKDLNDISDHINREEYLTEFSENANKIFSKVNLHKLEAIYGTTYVSALKNSIARMKSGINRPSNSGELEQKWLNWTNNSVGTIMFFNRRSALLQMLSFTNFVNWSDNNPMKAAAAFADQPLYWKTWVKIFNSDKLKERRSGLKSDIQESEIASQVINAKDKASAVIAYLLKLGFKPTQIADSFAIATGGATFLINRTKTYKKEGMSQAQAEAKAFEDFSAISDETQQSGDPMLISQQQSSHLGRLILAFQNTPMQYNRLIKKAGQDLINRRGSVATNLSKIAYYGFIQNFIFASLQSALFAMLPEFNPDDDDEKYNKILDNKKEKIINSMVDTLLRGSGLAGAVVSTLKNAIFKYYKEEKKGYTADHAQTLLELANISPPIGSKFRKVYNSIRTVKYEKDIIDYMGADITVEGQFSPSPAYDVTANLVSAGLNIPLDRALVEVKGIAEVLDSRNTSHQRIALALGWRTWDVNAKDEEQDFLKVVFKEVKKAEDAEKRKAKAAAKKEAISRGAKFFVFRGETFPIKYKNK